MNYYCIHCCRRILEPDVKWKIPNRAIMTMDMEELRKQLEGPYCPICNSKDTLRPEVE